LPGERIAVFKSRIPNASFVFSQYPGFHPGLEMFKPFRLAGERIAVFKSRIPNASFVFSQYPGFHPGLEMFKPFRLAWGKDCAM
jgi:hypothetical protein